MINEHHPSFINKDINVTPPLNGRATMLTIVALTGTSMSLQHLTLPLGEDGLQ